jgi:hypothetical protein
VAARSIGWPAGFWLTVCAGLAAVVAYQLFNSFPLAPTVTAAPPGAPALEVADRPALPRSPREDAVQEIVARPLLSADRRPYVPPPASVEAAAPAPTHPSLPLELAGTFLTASHQAALVLVSGGAPEWLRKGQQIDGWRIEVIEQDRVQLRKGDQEQVLRLRDDITVLKTAGPRAANPENRARREITGETADEGDEAEE